MSSAPTTPGCYLYFPTDAERRRYTKGHSQWVLKIESDEPRMAWLMSYLRGRTRVPYTELEGIWGREVPPLVGELIGIVDGFALYGEEPLWLHRLCHDIAKALLDHISGEDWSWSWNNADDSMRPIVHGLVHIDEIKRALDQLMGTEDGE